MTLGPGSMKHEFWGYHTCLTQWLCAGHLTNQGPLCCKVHWEAWGHKGSTVGFKSSVWVQCISPSNRKTDSQVSNNQSQPNFASLLKHYQLWSGFVGFEVSNFKTVTTGIYPVDLAALQNRNSALILVPAPTSPIYLWSNLFSKRCVGWGWEGVWWRGRRGEGGHERGRGEWRSLPCWAHSVSFRTS